MHHPYAGFLFEKVSGWLLKIHQQLQKPNVQTRNNNEEQETRDGQCITLCWFLISCFEDISGSVES
jgi:hypothetical protein